MSLCYFEFYVTFHSHLSVTFLIPFTIKAYVTIHSVAVACRCIATCQLNSSTQPTPCITLCSNCRMQVSHRVKVLPPNHKSLWLFILLKVMHYLLEVDPPTTWRKSAGRNFTSISTARFLHVRQYCSRSVALTYYLLYLSA